jgi:type II secretory pathway component PulL
VFGWFKSEQRERRRKVRLDRKHVEVGARRFLQNYLTAEETHKARYYRVLEDASQFCRPEEYDLPLDELEDARTAHATAEAAMKVVLERGLRTLDVGEPVSGFVTDAYATVAVAYHRAAGLYTHDSKMQQLGTAAVHLLTMATSFMQNSRQDRLP